MSEPINSANDTHSRLVKAIGARMAGFLSEEVGLEVAPPALKVDDIQRLQLRHLTSILSVEGDIRTLIACSFELPLIERVFEAYAEGVELEADERDAMMEETAAEVINVVVGNAMADVQTPGKAIGISPPVVLTEAKSITRHKDARFSTLELNTPSGSMSIHFLRPRDQFDQTLNYKESGQ